jgi:hypothetical protein|nr:MAG TPA: hypothetical protein [Caudoviricetes sp.]
MRLIDADAFKEQVAAIAIKDNLPAGKCCALCKLIEMQPTAGSWHRVADGDLPPEPKTEDDIKAYITVCKYDSDKYHKGLTIYSGTVDSTYGMGKKWWQENCAAWMELPEYEEENHAESC